MTHRSSSPDFSDLAVLTTVTVLGIMCIDFWLGILCGIGVGLGFALLCACFR